MFSLAARRTRLMVVTSGILLAGVCPASVGLTSEPPAKTEKPEKTEEALERSRKLVHRIASGYQLFLNDEEDPLQMEQPVLRWPNVTRNCLEGATYVWTKNGRPEAIACVWERNDVWSHAFHSLSESKLTAKHRGREFWHTQEAGIKFTPFPKAPEPADTPVKRLVQMKELAQRFKCRLPGQPEDLRFLTHPLYHYKTNRSDLIDGALFAFVVGTDPEVVLVLEAAKNGDKSEWRYVLTRRTVGNVEAELDGSRIWSKSWSYGSRNAEWFEQELGRVD